MNPLEYIIEDEKALSKNVPKLFQNLQLPLVLLIGDLGAGKTTMVKQFLTYLDCEDDGSSPSYSLINEYRTPQGPVYHIDLYRLETVEEVFALGIEDYLYSGNFCFVEWPQIVLDYIDEPYHVIKIEIVENNARKVTII